MGKKKNEASDELMAKLDRAIASLPKPEKHEPSAVELHLSKNDYAMYMSKWFGWQNPILRLLNTIKMHPAGVLPVESDQVEDGSPKIMMSDDTFRGAEAMEPKPTDALRRIADRLDDAHEKRDCSRDELFSMAEELHQMAIDMLAALIEARGAK